ncbi:MAG: hypothetical protein LBV12_11105 [Puniceicoccales bacterium]|jgi:hypothetical protein|nr:hypothetical protein [Puniceicoccales bacterium]
MKYHKTTSLIIIAALTCVLFAGCHTRPAPPAPPATVAVPVSGTELDQSNLVKVRFGETLKAYPVARYIDPADKNLLHESHLVYRKEASAAWNLESHSPTVVPLGPVMALSDPAERTRINQAEIEQKISSQERLMSALIEQNETLTAEITRLNKELSKLRESKPTTEKQP